MSFKIDEFGDIPDDIKEMIDNPILQFNEVQLIDDQRIVSIMQSPLLFTLADLKAHCPHFFNMLEGICAGLRKFAKSLKKIH